MLKNTKWWMDILLGIILILAGCFIHFDWLYVPHPETVHRAKTKSTILVWNKFIEYGGGWILLLLAAYYGVDAIQKGYKKYKALKNDKSNSSESL